MEDVPRPTHNGQQRRATATARRRATADPKKEPAQEKARAPHRKKQEPRTGKSNSPAQEKVRAPHGQRNSPAGKPGNGSPATGTAPQCGTAPQGESPAYGTAPQCGTAPHAAMPRRSRSAAHVFVSSASTHFPKHTQHPDVAPHLPWRQVKSQKCVKLRDAKVS